MKRRMGEGGVARLARRGWWKLTGEWTPAGSGQAQRACGWGGGDRVRRREEVEEEVPVA